jgi:hypothetical protein
MADAGPDCGRGTTAAPVQCLAVTGLTQPASVRSRAPITRPSLPCPLCVEWYMTPDQLTDVGERVAGWYSAEMQAERQHLPR